MCMCAYVCVCACVCVCVRVCGESRPRVPLTSTQALSLTHSLSVTRARARARTHGTLATAGVTIALSVQYLQQPEEVVDEIARVLQPGGKCIVAFSNRMFPSKVSACLLACALCVCALRVCALRASRVRQCEGLLFAPPPLLFLPTWPPPLPARGRAGDLWLAIQDRGAAIATRLQLFFQLVPVCVCVCVCVCLSVRLSVCLPVHLPV